MDDHGSSPPRPAASLRQYALSALDGDEDRNLPRRMARFLPGALWAGPRPPQIVVYYDERMPFDDSRLAAAPPIASSWLRRYRSGLVAR
jgi:hypothetical protein